MSWVIAHAISAVKSETPQETRCWSAFQCDVNGRVDVQAGRGNQRNPTYFSHGQQQLNLCVRYPATDDVKVDRLMQPYR